MYYIAVVGTTLTGINLCISSGKQIKDWFIITMLFFKWWV